MKHTKGPWEVVGEDTVVAGPPKHYSSGSYSCRGVVTEIDLDDDFDADEARANARLIAAAPELLEALTMVRDADEDCKRDGLPTIPASARAVIDAAIAKAEGNG